VQDIVNFETQLRTAQAIDSLAGSLNAEGANSGEPFSPAIFDLFSAWTNSKNAARASIARGQAVFSSKTIHIEGVAGLNDVLVSHRFPAPAGPVTMLPTSATIPSPCL